MNLALFDFDGTVSKRDNYKDFLFFALSKKDLFYGFIKTLPYIIGYYLRLISRSKIRKYILELGLKGQSEQVLLNKGASFSVSHIPKYIDPRATNRLKWHMENGDKIVIVSASFDFYLAPWCRHHGYDLIATKIEFTDNKVSGNYIGVDCYGHHKLSAIKDKFNLSEYKSIYAYGDSYEDLAMLSIADYKYINWKQV